MGGESAATRPPIAYCESMNAEGEDGGGNAEAGEGKGDKWEGKERLKDGNLKKE